LSFATLIVASRAFARTAASVSSFAAPRRVGKAALWPRWPRAVAAIARTCGFGSCIAVTSGLSVRLSPRRASATTADSRVLSLELASIVVSWPMLSSASAGRVSSRKTSAIPATRRDNPPRMDWFD
jgi:hypothetical protein